MGKPPYASKFEASLAKSMKKRNVEFSFEPVEIPFVLHKTYVPDFVLPNKIIIEAKGLLTPYDRQKMKAVKSQYPLLDIRFVFQNAKSPLSKFSKKTYADWAEENGFKWADGQIPQHWIDEI